MKEIFKEVFVPVSDFYKIRLIREKVLIVLLPCIIGAVSLFVAILAKSSIEDAYGFTNDILNQLITIIALFVSFSIANLSLIMTSSSENVTELKKCECKEHKIKNKRCTLYQVIINEISYLIVVDLILLILILGQKFVVSFFDGLYMKIILSVDVAIFGHILIITLMMLKDIYFSFWRNR